jgi:protein-arginine kinase activator protein McsA
MNIFKYFMNNKNLDDLINKLNDDLIKSNFKPHTNKFMVSQESGFDDNGEWVKSTFKTDDGNILTVTVWEDLSTKNGDTDNNLEDLERELTHAVESQNFEKAIKLRDLIKKNKSNEKVIKVFESDLKDAIKNQDFEKCIDLRDKIKDIKSR